MIIRKIGKLIRGDATPFQIMAACVLGALIGFVPGFAQAPGLLIALIALLIILNANLFAAGLVGVAAKLVALLITPVSFALGRFLLEGPASGFFATMVNAPVLAFFGFEYYVVTGGQLLGLLFGVVCGFFVIRAMKGLWRRLASLENDSERFKQWTQKRWVKISGFLFLGGLKGKKDWDQLASRRFGNPIRLTGAVLVIVLLAGGFFAVRFLDDAFVANMVRANLEKANGATVDLAGASLDLGAGKLILNGLAMADPGALETNLFAAESIEAGLGTADLLRKRAVIDSVVVSGGSQGGSRETMGKLVGPEPKPQDKRSVGLPDMQTIEEVFSNPEELKRRLATLQRWLDRLSGASATEGEGVTWEEVLKARVEALGYNALKYDALIENTPQLLIRRLEANGVKTASLPGQTLDIRGENLSTQPALVKDRSVFRIVSSSGDLKAELGLPSGGSAATRLDFLFTGLDVDEVAALLKRKEPLPMQGGKLDISADGALSSVNSDLAVSLLVKNSKLKLGGSGEKSISQLAIPVAVRGPIASPSIRVDSSALQNSLVDAGKQELTNRLGGELDKLLGGKKKAEDGEPPKGEDAAKKPDETLKDAAGGLFDGLLKKKGNQ